MWERDMDSARIGGLSVEVHADSVPLERVIYIFASLVCVTTCAGQDAA